MGKGQGSSSEELEDYANSDSGNDWGEDGGEDGEDGPIISRYATINFFMDSNFIFYVSFFTHHIYFSI